MEYVGQMVEWLRASVAEGVIALAVLLLALLAGLCARFVLRRLRLFLRMGLCGLFLAVAAVLVSDKPPGRMENGEWKMENEVLARSPRVIVHCPLSILHSNGVTDEDISNGWREVSRSTDALGASVFAVPEDGLVWDEARARGARRGYWHIPATGWSFPGAGFGWTNGFVWAEGMFRPKVESKRDGLVILNHGLALAPAANWARYGLDASLFWCRTNAVGGLVGTFLGAAVDDDPARIVNAQFELFPTDGRLALRYDLSRAGEGVFEAGPFEEGEGRFVSLATNTSEVVLQRVHPDDWDMDGIPNALDESPRVPGAVLAWGQSEEWAALAFPSNAAEIAAAGSYLAWATARGGETNRHLVGFSIESPDGVWPICVTFGDLQVMCNSTNTLYFAIDDGARYAYGLSAGRLAAVEVCGEDRFDTASFDGEGPVDRVSYPGLVTLRLETMRTGWIGRLPTVEVAGLEYAHFFPGDSLAVTAQVSNCHSDAYVGCEWSSSDPGVVFADSHSLETVIAWQTTESVSWKTNRVMLVTTYAGDYAVTNGYVVSLGVQSVPTTTLYLDVPSVQFLNDGVGGDRKERYYPVTLTLVASPGTRGTIRLFCEGQSSSSLFWDKGDTPFGGRTPVSLEVPCSGGYSASEVMYVSSARCGLGSVSASLELDDGISRLSSAPFEVIEPIRRLVTNDRYGEGNRLVNPPCLVMGTNAVFKVSVRKGAEVEGGFSVTNIKWKVVSGSKDTGVDTLVEGNDSYAIVRPVDMEEIVIEARFNSDTIQPTFRLPVVMPTRIPVQAVLISPSLLSAVPRPWSPSEVSNQVQSANEVFAQVGISFDLQSVTNVVGHEELWDLSISDEVDEAGTVLQQDMSTNLVSLCRTQGCIQMYYVGSFSSPSVRGFRHPDGGIVLCRKTDGLILAHELGHELDLFDAYYFLNDGRDLSRASELVDRSTFWDTSLEDSNWRAAILDWGDETGRGFYSSEDTIAKVMEELLMHGYPCSDRRDLPGGLYLSLNKYSETSESVHSPVGFECIKREIKEAK